MGGAERLSVEELKVLVEVRHINTLKRNVAGGRQGSRTL